jgi:hypothetical protein
VNRSKPPPSECPVCGAPVPPKARACPECGADERSGWDEDAARYDGLDLPDSAFGEDAGEAGGPPPGSRSRRLLWGAAALVVIAAFLYLVLRGVF